MEQSRSHAKEPGRKRATKLREQTSLSYKAGHRCNNTSKATIIDPEKYRILTLIKRLDNKLNKVNTVTEIDSTYNDYVSPNTTDHAISKVSNNISIPSSYRNSMLQAKTDVMYPTGLYNTMMQKKAPIQIMDQLKAKGMQIK